MSSTINLQALGLNYSPNTLSLPDGSLIQADNVIIRRDNTVESRRGIKDYSNPISDPQNRAKQLIEYKNRILVHIDSKLYYDSGKLTDELADYYAFSGTYEETQDGLRIKSIEANKNLYFTTKEGVKKISAQTADDFTTASGFIKNAGAAKALDVTASLDIYQGQKDGFLPQDSTVAYRVLWGYKDKNENLLLGTPSNRYVVYNNIVDSMAMDINTLCLKLDNLSSGSSLINDGNYLDSFYTSLNPDTTTLKTTVTSLAKKLDEDILLANTFGTGAPLKINSISMDGGGLTTIFFESGDPTQYTSINDYIKIKDLVDLSTVSVISITAGETDTTIVTNNNHNLSVGNTIVIRGTGTILDETWEVKSIINNTSFSIQKRTKVQISSISTGKTPKIVTVEPHGLINGNKITITGTTVTTVHPAGGINTSGSEYYTVSKIDDNSFTITLPIITAPNQKEITVGSGIGGNVGLYIENSGSVDPSADLVNLNEKQQITNVTYKNIIINSVTPSISSTENTTINTNIAHGFSIGDVVNISGVSINSVRIDAIETGVNPAKITTKSPHRLTSGNTITISNAVPAISGSYVVTVIDDLNFTIPTTVASPVNITNASVVYSTPLSALNGIKIITQVTDTSFEIEANTYLASISVSSAFVKKSSINFIYTPKQENTISAFNALNISSQLVKINSYNYTILTETGDSLYAIPIEEISPSIPGTSEQNRIINNTLLRIIDRLKIELSGVISTELKTKYIDTIFLTDSANVKLDITIPIEVVDNDDYFYQVYRTRTFIADGTQTLGTSGGNPVEADDEMRLVQEGFPTIEERNDRVLIYIDQSPESLVANNTNLYTNPETGVGILNANEPPPFAKDINRFKNVVFYSNTRTKQKLTSFQLLGLANISNNDKITITNSNESQTYTFTYGASEETRIDILSSTPVDFANKYIKIYSANNINNYEFFYLVNSNNIGSFSVAATFPNGETVLVIVYYSAPHNLTVGDKITLYGLINNTNDVDFNGDYAVSDVINSNIFRVITNKPNTIIGSSVNTANAYWIPIKNNLKVVDILSTDSSTQIAKKTSDNINTIVYDFISENISNVITSIGAGTFPSSTPTITTFSNHNLLTGDKVTISGSDSPTSPSGGIDGTYTITKTGDKTFTISLTGGKQVTAAGTTGSFISNKFIVTNNNEGKTNPIDISSLSSQVSKQIITVGNGEDAANNQVLLSSLVSAAQAIEQTAQSLVRVINKKDTLLNSFYISSETTPPGQIVLESKTLDENPFYVIGSNGDIGKSFSPDISPIHEISGLSVNPSISVITGTIGSNVITLNTINNHGLYNADKVVISGSNSNPIVDGLYTVFDCTDTTFKIFISSNFVSSGNYFAYSKPIDTIVSDNEVKPNRIYYSKANEPESVPLLNYFDVSAEDKEIVRIYPLRNSLFVFKEDGTYRVSGETAPFVTSLLDSSCVVRAPDSVSATNNIVYAWTTKGVTPISEAGASQEVSRPIDTEILRLSSAKFPNFRSLTWGVGYDSDSSYTVYTNSNPEDDYATIGFRYCTLTNSWTNVTRSQTCGLISTEEDKMYLGSGIDNIINQERKNFDRTDYSDKDFYVNLSGNSVFIDPNGKQILSFPSVSEINIGDVILQEQDLTIFWFNNLLKQIDTDPSIISFGNNNYYELLKASPGNNIRIKIVQLAEKLDADAAVIYSDYAERIANKSVDINENYNGNPTQVYSGTKEITQITIPPTYVGYGDLSAFQSKWFFINCPDQNYYFWYNVDGGGVDPGINNPLFSGRIGKRIDVSIFPWIFAGEIYQNLMNKTQQVLSTCPSFSNSLNYQTFTITNNIEGNVDETIGNVPGMTVNVIQNGENQELINGRQITITGTQFPQSINSINGTYIVSDTGTYKISSTFTIPVEVTTPGGSGLSFETDVNSFQDIKACFNHLVERLNSDPGLTYDSYQPIVDKTPIEAIVIDVDTVKKQITIESPLDWIVGPIKVFNAINCEIKYSPITMGDTLNIKQLFDTTIMLKDRNVTKFMASFSSDLKPEYTDVVFIGEGGGLFGYYPKGFGYGNFGGQSNNAPFRTLVPLQNQRCRYLNYKINHKIAREVFVLYGVSVTGNVGISFRGYR